jgi:hypothetical protein
MFTLLALFVAAVVLVSVFGLLASVAALVLWLVTLPFRILAWVFKGFAGLLALPFLLVFAVLGVAFLAAGMVVFLVPLVPFALLAAAIWWLVHRRRPIAAP